MFRVPGMCCNKPNGWRQMQLRTDALAAAVRRLAHDPGLRAKLRVGGEKTAPRYTEEVFNAAVVREVERR